MSSATPLPTALAIVTLPARAALTMPGAAEHRVGPELHRVEEVVVDAPVDRRRPAARRRSCACRRVVAADQVAALDQLDAHLPGQERVLEVGGVVDAGREHARRVGSSTPAGAAARSAASSRRRVVGDRPDPLLGEQLGEAPGPSPGGSRSRRTCPDGDRAGCPPAPGSRRRRRGRGRCPATWTRTPFGGLDARRLRGGSAASVATSRRGHDAVGEDLAGAVDVGEERLERPDPLARRPPRRRAHSAAEITRGTRSSGNGRSSPRERERDALVEEGAVERLGAHGEVGGGGGRDGVVQGPVGRAHAPVAVEHLVERLRRAVGRVRGTPSKSRWSASPTPCGPRDPRLEPRVLLTLRHPDGRSSSRSATPRDQRDV